VYIFAFCFLFCFEHSCNVRATPFPHPHAVPRMFILPLRPGLGEIPYVPITETFIQTVIQTIPPVTQIEIHTEIQTVTVPPAANTRVAARPAPEEFIDPGPVTEKVRPTTAVEVVVEQSLSLPTPEVVAEEVEEITEEVDKFRGRTDEFRGRTDEFRGRTDEFDDDRFRERTVTVVQRPRQTRRPAQWFEGRW